MKKLVKKIYSWIPLKKELFSAVRLVWAPPERIYRHLHFEGIINVPIDKSNKFLIKHYGFHLENSLFWSGLTGGWERTSVETWIRLCKKSEIVFDIGANTGVYSLIAKAMNKDAKVYAFEPVKRVFEKLKNNNKLNNYDINCEPFAISNNTGTAVIYDTDAEHTYSVTVNKNRFPTTAKTISTEIQTITLDDFIEEKGIKKIDLIKIDVETHEAEVLEGFNKYIKRFKPTILIEILNDEVGEKVEKVIAGLDYCIFKIDEQKGLEKVERIKRNKDYNHLLCSTEIARALDLL